jgi:hypothetical protein
MTRDKTTTPVTPFEKALDDFDDATAGIAQIAEMARIAADDIMRQAVAKRFPVEDVQRAEALYRLADRMMLREYRGEGQITDPAYYAVTYGLTGTPYRILDMLEKSPALRDLLGVHEWQRRLAAMADDQSEPEPQSQQPPRPKIGNDREEQ